MQIGSSAGAFSIWPVLIAERFSGEPDTVGATISLCTGEVGHLQASPETDGTENAIVAVHQQNSMQKEPSCNPRVSVCPGK